MLAHTPHMPMCTSQGTALISLLRVWGGTGPFTPLLSPDGGGHQGLERRNKCPRTGRTIRLWWSQDPKSGHVTVMCASSLHQAAFCPPCLCYPGFPLRSFKFMEPYSWPNTGQAHSCSPKCSINRRNRSAQRDKCTTWPETQTRTPRLTSLYQALP